MVGNCQYFHFASVDESFDNFYDIIYEAMHEYIPQITACNSKYPQWYDHEIISIKNEKFLTAKMYFSWSKYIHFPSAFAKFSQLRSTSY